MALKFERVKSMMGLITWAVYWFQNINLRLGQSSWFVYVLIACWLPFVRVCFVSFSLLWIRDDGHDYSPPVHILCNSHTVPMISQSNTYVNGPEQSLSTSWSHPIDSGLQNVGAWSGLSCCNFCFLRPPVFWCLRPAGSWQSYKWTGHTKVLKTVTLLFWGNMSFRRMLGDWRQ